MCVVVARPINNPGSTLCACSIIEEQQGGRREVGARRSAIAHHPLWSLSPRKKGGSVSQTKPDNDKHRGYEPGRGRS